MDARLKELVAVQKRLLPLKELPRIGWILEGAPRDAADSIAAHSHMVVLGSLLAARQLDAEYGPFNLERMLTMAALHDAGESVTGDFDAGLKRRLDPGEQALLEKIESRALGDLLSDLQGKDALLAIAREYDAGTSKEAKLVKFADVLDAFAHARVRLGRVFSRYLDHSKSRLRRGSPADDGGLGQLLAEWIEGITAEWESIEPKAFE